MYGMSDDEHRHFVEQHMTALSEADIDALTNIRIKTIMQARARASADVRRRARLDKLRAKLGRRGGDAA